MKLLLWSFLPVSSSGLGRFRKSAIFLVFHLNTHLSGACFVFIRFSDSKFHACRPLLFSPLFWGFAFEKSFTVTVRFLRRESRVSLKIRHYSEFQNGNPTRKTSLSRGSWRPRRGLGRRCPPCWDGVWSQLPDARPWRSLWNLQKEKLIFFFKLQQAQVSFGGLGRKKTSC